MGSITRALSAINMARTNGNKFELLSLSDSSFEAEENTTTIQFAPVSDAQNKKKKLKRYDC